MKRQLYSTDPWSFNVNRFVTRDQGTGYLKSTRIMEVSITCYTIDLHCVLSRIMFALWHLFPYFCLAGHDIVLFRPCCVLKFSCKRIRIFVVLLWRPLLCLGHFDAIIYALHSSHLFGFMNLLYYVDYGGALESKRPHVPGLVYWKSFIRLIRTEVSANTRLDVKAPS